MSLCLKVNVCEQFKNCYSCLKTCSFLSVILPFRVFFNPHRRKQPFCSFHYMRVTIPLTQQSMTFFEINNLQRDKDLIYLLIYLSLYCFMMCPSSNSSQQPNNPTCTNDHILNDQQMTDRSLHHRQE